MERKPWQAPGVEKWKEVELPPVEVVDEEDGVVGVPEEQAKAALGKLGFARVEEKVGRQGVVRRAKRAKFDREPNVAGLVEERASEGGVKGYFRHTLEDVYRAALWALANKDRARKQEEAPFALAWNLLEFMRSDPGVEKALWLKVLDLAAKGREQMVGGGYADGGECLVQLERMLKKVGGVNEDVRGEEVDEGLADAV